DRRGHYSMNGLNTAHYLVEFEPCSFESALAGQLRAGTVKVVAGHSVRGVNAALRAGGSVSGAVRYSRGSMTHPAPGTCIEVLPLGKLSVGAFSIATNGGKYVATNLLPGSYKVLFGDPGCSADAPTSSAGLSGVIKVAS